MRIFKKISDQIFGYDFFICYRQADARSFAEALYQELTTSKYNFDVFWDVKHFAAGKNIQMMQKRALKRSTRLIVLTSEQAAVPKTVMDKDHMLEEIRLFKKSKSRVIIPIGSEKSFNLPNSVLLSEIPDYPSNLCIIDDGLASSSQRVSPCTIEKLVNDFTESRQQVKQIRLLSLAVVILAIASFVAVATSISANKNLRESERSRKNIEDVTYFLHTTVRETLERQGRSDTLKFLNQSLLNYLKGNKETLEEQYSRFQIEILVADAKIYLETNLYEEAIEALAEAERVIKVSPEYFEEEHMHLLKVLILGKKIRAYTELGDLEKANTLYLSADELLRDIEKNHQSAAVNAGDLLLNSQIQYLERLDDYNGIKRLLLNRVSIYDKDDLVSNDFMYNHILNLTALSDRLKSEAELVDCLKYAREARSILEGNQELMSDQSLRQRVYLALGKALVKNGLNREASAELSKAVKLGKDILSRDLSIALVTELTIEATQLQIFANDAMLRPTEKFRQTLPSLCEVFVKQRPASSRPIEVRADCLITEAEFLVENRDFAGAKKTLNAAKEDVKILRIAYNFKDSDLDDLDVRIKELEIATK